jgi:hypothetical protein
MVKSGIKTWTMLSSLVLALVCVSGCNSDDTTTTDSTAPKGGGVSAPAKPTDTKPAGGAPAPTKPDDKK